jgi:hypothetical protein
MSGGGAPEIEQTIDLGFEPSSGGEDSLSESDSVEDEGVPIRIQKRIESITSILEEEEAKDNMLNEPLDEMLTDDEKREKARHEYSEKRRKHQRRQESEQAENHSSLRRDAGARRQNDVTGIPRELDDLKSMGKLQFEDISIDDYLNDKFTQNAHMTKNIKSTLNNLDSVLGKPKKFTGVISESNSSEGEE